MPEIEVIRVIKILIIFKIIKDFHQPIGCQHLGLQWVEEEEGDNHYWLEDKTPIVQSHDVICLDYSVAK